MGGIAKVGEKRLHSVVVGVARHHQGARPERGCDEPQHVDVDVFGSVEEKQVELDAERRGQGGQGVADSDFHQIGEPGGFEVAACAFGLVGGRIRG